MSNTDETTRDRSYTGAMQRITFRAPEGMIEELEAALDEGAAPNQSVFIRDAIAEKLARRETPIRCDGGKTDGGGVKGRRILNCDNCGQITLHAIVYSEHYDQDCYRCGQCKLTKPSEQITLQEAAEP